MSNLTIDNLPEEVNKNSQKLDSILVMLSNLSESKSEPTDIWFDVDGYRAYNPEHPKRPTVYAQVSKNTIPYHKRGKGKKLYFLKSEIDAWLKDGRKETDSEIKSNAGDYVTIKN